MTAYEKLTLKVQLATLDAIVEGFGGRMRDTASALRAEVESAIEPAPKPRPKGKPRRKA